MISPISTFRGWVGIGLGLFPPCLNLLGGRKTRHNPVLRPPRWFGSLDESKAILSLLHQLRARYQERLVVGDRPLRHPLFRGYVLALLRDLPLGKPFAIRELLLKVIEGVENLPVGVGYVYYGSLTHLVEDSVSRRVIVGDGLDRHPTFPQVDEAAVSLLQPRVGGHHREEVRPEPRSVGDLIVVESEVRVAQRKDHPLVSGELPQPFPPQKRFAGVVGGGCVGEQLRAER